MVTVSTSWLDRDSCALFFLDGKGDQFGLARFRDDSDDPLPKDGTRFLARLRGRVARGDKPPSGMMRPFYLHEAKVVSLERIR